MYFAEIICLYKNCHKKGAARKSSSRTVREDHTNDHSYCITPPGLIQLQEMFDMRKYKYRKRFTYKGKTYSVYADTLVELGRRYAEKLSALENGSDTVSSNTLISSWAVRCIETYKTGQKENTRKRYMRRVRHCILDKLGSRTVGDVTPIELQQVLNLQEGKSKTQINEVYQALRFLFRHAVENHMRTDDPTLYLTKPSGTHHGRRALTPSERAAVLTVGKTDRRYYLYLLMIECGCRPSEAAECMGRDIMIEDGCYMLHIRGTKTAKADRIVPIPNDLADLICRTPKFEYIAQTRVGKKITNHDRLWHSFKRQLNIYMGCKVYRNELIPPYPLAPDLVPYCFRHEYCSELARRGIDIRIAQKLMGHSSIDMTANIYTHVEKNDILQAARILNKTTTQTATQAENR